MKKLALICVLSAACGVSLAQVKPCDELKTEIAAKIVKFRAAAQQYRFLRIRNRGKSGPASLSEIRVFGGSAAP